MQAGEGWAERRDRLAHFLILQNNPFIIIDFFVEAIFGVKSHLKMRHIISYHIKV